MKGWTRPRSLAWIKPNLPDPLIVVVKFGRTCACKTIRTNETGQRKAKTVVRRAEALTETVENRRQNGYHGRSVVRAGAMWEKSG